MKTKICLFIFFITSGSHLISAQDNNIISFSENIFYTGNNSLVHEEIKRLNKGKVNFKAQTSFSMEVPESNLNSPDTVKKAENLLTDVNNFDNIPYYSKRHKTIYPLFKNITVLEDYLNNEENRIITAEQTIPPFKPAKIQYTIYRTDNFLFYKATNIESINWWIFPVIGKNKLIVLFSAELKGNKLECYGLGVADTGSFFFARKRIKEAFNGRTKALISWIHHVLDKNLAVKSGQGKKIYNAETIVPSEY